MDRREMYRFIANEMGITVDDVMAMSLSEFAEAYRRTMTQVYVPPINWSASTWTICSSTSTPDTMSPKKSIRRHDTMTDK
jgi:hypothetical protein